MRRDGVDTWGLAASLRVRYADKSSDSPRRAWSSGAPTEASLPLDSLSADHPLRCVLEGVRLIRPPGTERQRRRTGRRLRSLAALWCRTRSSPWCRATLRCRASARAPSREAAGAGRRAPASAGARARPRRALTQVVPHMPRRRAEPRHRGTRIFLSGISAARVSVAA